MSDTYSVCPSPLHCRSLPQVVEGPDEILVQFGEIATYSEPIHYTEFCLGQLVAEVFEPIKTVKTASA